MDEAALFQITSETKVPPIEVQVQINDCQVRMEVTQVQHASHVSRDPESAESA